MISSGEKWKMVNREWLLENSYWGIVVRKMVLGIGRKFNGFTR